MAREAYREGWDACLRGEEPSSCPYVRPGRRAAWMRGYAHAARESIAADPPAAPSYSADLLDPLDRLDPSIGFAFGWHLAHRSHDVQSSTDRADLAHDAADEFTDNDVWYDGDGFDE